MANQTMDKNLKRLGKNISRIRRQKGMSSEQLAYQNGISKGYMSDIENGKRLPSLAMLAKIAKSLSASMQDFFKD